LSEIIILLLKKIKYGVWLTIMVSAILSCKPGPGNNTTETGRKPDLNQDLDGITIPCNIAPLNFIIKEKGSAYALFFKSGSEKIARIKSRNGIIRIREKIWKAMLKKHAGESVSLNIFTRDLKGQWLKYKVITINISRDQIDKYLTYRILYPGYESWKEILIKQRNLETFREWSVMENSIADQNCLNCHSYNNITGDFLLHVRGSIGGTLFYNGKDLRKINLKTKEMKNGAVYPRWHPSGKFVAFSSNKIIQQFHSALPKKVEVSDLESSLVLYDMRSGLIMNIDLSDGEQSMDTYPEWSSDGSWLYFCRAKKPAETFDYSKVYYSLYRVRFDSVNISFGKPELILNASDSAKSVSFPRISPDGRYLIFTLHNYGSFPIWHKEADLYRIDLATLKTSRMELNSDFTDSYHTWSSDSRWLVFSSKRIDGLTTRLFISHIDSSGIADKPFILPQKDPEFYGRFLKSFNLPELSTIKVDISPGKIRKVVASKAIQAGWADKETSE
jgi:Tol biopolymer transport system component